MSPPPVIKYPRTSHLFDAGGSAVTADDSILPDTHALSTTLCDGKTRIVIEEKIDGANLGISLDPATLEILVQNRNHYISSGEHAQFSRITEWIQQHREPLMNILGEQLGGGERILYGEWMAARHSIRYHKLPGLFVAFDIYEKKEDKLFSRSRFHATMKGSGIPVVPVVAVRTFGPYTRRQKQNGTMRLDLLSFLDSKSAFRDDNGTVEGIVLRVDTPEWCQHRCKIVRPDFVRGCNDGHWLSRSIEKQRVDSTFSMEYMKVCYVLAGAEDGEDKDSKLPAISSMMPRSKQSKLPKEAREYIAQRARCRRRVPHYVMLMGLPGSGKSTFALTLAASAPSEWTLVNQDRMGKKKCISLAGSNTGKKKRVILDRCHPTESERREWYDVVGSPSRDDIALVYFAASVDTCIERVKRRTNHETIPEGKGERIVRCVAKTLQAPTDEEKCKVFGIVEVVRTFEESNALLYRWGVNDLP